jgi:hypothetical protein
MTDSTGAARFRRPAPIAEPGQLQGPAKPEPDLAAAHRSAAALVAGAHDLQAGETAARLDAYVRREGIAELAELWSHAHPVSLPGALYQLVLLREWITRNPVQASQFFGAGRQVAEYAHVVAGVSDPPDPDAVVALADAVLSAAFDGDLGDALDRASAFCRVVSAGRAHDTPVDDLQHTRLAAGNITMAQNLAQAANAWRAGQLD